MNHLNEDEWVREFFAFADFFGISANIIPRNKQELLLLEKFDIRNFYHFTDDSFCEDTKKEDVQKIIEKRIQNNIEKYNIYTIFFEKEDYYISNIKYDKNYETDEKSNFYWEGKIIIPEGIKYLSKLKFLNLSGENSEHRNKGIPVEIFNFTNLEYLDLSSNHLESIPSEIRNLQKLKYLNLSYNYKLDYLDCPPEIDGSQSLTYPLYIPEELFLLSSLEELNLNHCGITSISNNIIKLENLKKLILSSNGGHQSKNNCSFLVNMNLNLKIFQLKNLEELDISSCDIEEFPWDKEFELWQKIGQKKDIENLISMPKNLKKLDISNNKFDNEGIKGFLLYLLNNNHLEELDISYIEIDKNLENLLKMKITNFLNYEPPCIEDFEDRDQKEGYESFNSILGIEEWEDPEDYGYGK